jgi:hypothetical protein
MKTTLKVFAWVGIVIGGLAILACIEEFDFAAFIGGGLFLSWGICTLAYFKK